MGVTRAMEALDRANVEAAAPVASRPDVGGRVALRPVAQSDREFLYRLYATTRADELAVVEWDEAQKETFLRQQFEAQDTHYRRYYPDASFDVVLVDGLPAGRLYVDRWAEEVRIMDIALLPEHRRQGVGSFLLRRVMDEAAGSGRKVSIHVEMFNPALELYARLGFVRVADRGVYHLMEWSGRRADATAHNDREG